MVVKIVFVFELIFKSLSLTFGSISIENQSDLYWYFLTCQDILLSFIKSLFSAVFFILIKENLNPLNLKTVFKIEFEVCFKFCFNLEINFSFISF